MKRFHVHVNVRDLEASIRFYSNLFAVDPAVVKTDYAKWMLEDPRLNFAISTRDRAVGVDHLGLQADTGDELSEIGQRLASADAVALAETGTTCCYAHSDKYWAEDPQGLRWETFHTFGEATTYYAPNESAPNETVPNESAPEKSAACCGPSATRAVAGSTGQSAACCGPAASGSSRCGG